MEYEFCLEQKYLQERQVEARILTAAQADTVDKQQTVLAEMERSMSIGTAARYRSRAASPTQARPRLNPRSRRKVSKPFSGG